MGAKLNKMLHFNNQMIISHLLQFFTKSYNHITIEVSSPNPARASYSIYFCPYLYSNTLCRSQVQTGETERASPAQITMRSVPKYLHLSIKIFFKTQQNNHQDICSFPFVSTPHLAICTELTTNNQKKSQNEKNPKLPTSLRYVFIQIFSAPLSQPCS